MKDVDDSIVNYGAKIHLPITTNLDFKASVGQSKLEGMDPDYGYDVEGTGTGIGTLLAYHFLPGAFVDPFLSGGIVWVKSENEFTDGYDSVSLDDDDTGYTVGGGVEINISKELSIIPEIVYQSEMFEEDEILVGIGFNAWLSKQVVLNLSGDYSL